VEWPARRLVKEGLATITEMENMQLVEVAIWNHILDEFNAAEKRAQKRTQK